ncbi:hypothetical protein CNEO3_760009 [Clostridium neonatale]|jgi:hypothetical protein|nr:hypothetical protein CNEO4_260067 [Clostridium neonatale]CAI3690281.1 hypothetical protein CNEO3_760009 [Clostridium neonatale]DAZ06794.1 MAG TPA: hypothetical protein [Caudoviricetes sp.]
MNYNIETKIEFEISKLKAMFGEGGEDNGK